MGGWGSGRHWQSKDTTADYRQLDVRRLQRDGLLDRRYSFNWQWSGNGEAVADINIRPEWDRVILSYRHCRSDGDLKSEEYPVALERTQCHYGGERVWFHCPARGCGRRVAILYGGKIFACRQCHQLAYESQREQPHYRALSRLQNVHLRLGGSGAVADGLPPKPKGMHWTTYRALANRFHRQHMAMDSAAAAYFGLVC